MSPEVQFTVSVLVAILAAASAGFAHYATRSLEKSDPAYVAAWRFSIGTNVLAVGWVARLVWMKFR